MDESPEQWAARSGEPSAGLARELGAGWLTAAGWAAAAAAAGLILAEGLAFLALAAAGRGGPSVVLTAKVGDVLFLWFHHAGMVFETRGRATAPAIGSGLTFSFTLALAVLGGTVLSVWMLARGGGAVARRAGATPGGAARAAPVPPLVAGFHGMKVAVPYGALCLAASTAAHFSARLGANPIIPPELSVHPRYLTVVGWSLAVGAVAGFAGGVRATGRGGVPSEASVDRVIRGALSGGARMLALGMAGAFAGLLVLGAIHPSQTRRYFASAFGQGALRGTTLVATNVLVAPNMAAWVLFPSMGSCVGIQGSRSDCVLSYSHFPGGAAGSRLGGSFGRLLPARQVAAPPGYLLFLLVPVVAVVTGGVRAASRSGARTRWEALAVGAAAGLVFAALCLVLVALASITGAVGVGLGRTAASTYRVGPDPVPSVLFSLLWGVAGGALGGLARGPEPAGRRRLVEGSPEPIGAKSPEARTR